MSRLLATLAACLATASAQYSYGSSAPPAPASQMMDSYPMSYESGSSMMGGMLISTYGGGSSSWTMVNQPMDSTSTPMTHNVTVGGSAGLVYSPDSIMANVGDYVIFTFMSENHTATQSNFATPCVKLDGAFDSGFMPNPNNTVNPPPAMKFQVMVSTPLWFYCRQKTPEVHCGKGMTFSINPTSTKTQAMFQAMAIQQNGTSTSSSMMSGVSTIVAPPPGAPPAAATGSSSIIMGSGYMNGDTCTCQCLCGSDSFPSAGQGMNMMGGMGGSIPNVMAMPAPPAPAGQSIPPPPPPPPMSSSYMMAAPPPPPPMMSAPAAASGSYGSSW